MADVRIDAPVTLEAGRSDGPHMGHDPRLMPHAHSRTLAMTARYGIAFLLGAAVIATIAAYPLGWQAPLAIVAVYAALLWLRPSAFLVILPIVIPALDLGLWTGWTLVDEADVFVLATLAILLARAPPSWPDIRPGGIAGWSLTALIAAWTIALATGLASHLGVGPSDNIFLEPENAIRVGKSLVEAVALLPFMRRRQRLHGDTITLFSRGMAAGLLVVTLIVVAERLLFTDLLDFSGAYRVAGPFSSMRVGGGHIGAYTALALPFTLCLITLRPRWAAACALAVGLAGGTYTLAATLARTGYAAGVVGLGITGAAWLVRRQARPGRAAARLLPIALVILALAAITGFTGMRARFADTGADFTTREGNWRAGLAVRDSGILPTLLGMGLGTYQRTMFARSDVNRPSDVALRRDGEAVVVVAMSVNTPFYLGQKIGVDGKPIRIRLQARAIGAADGLTVSLCDKVLLYSDQCRGAALALKDPGRWQTMDATVETGGLGQAALFGLLHRPVELSIFGGPGQIEIRDVVVTDATSTPVLANAGFLQGLDRWLITDDRHVSWRMLNVYLMLFFETGLIGVAAYLALAGSAMLAGLTGAMRGTVYAAAVTGSIASFLVSGLFDDVLEAPRVATLFFLIACSALVSPARAPQDGPDRSVA